MTYKDLFAIDDLFFNERKNVIITDEDKHRLNNYSYYEPQLDDDFYLKYFIHKLLFGTDIMELSDFIRYHFNNCDNPEKFLSLLDLKVIPKIEEINDNAQIDLSSGGNFKDKKLDEGFYETEGVIWHWNYNYSFMLHYVAAVKLHKDLIKRVRVIVDFIESQDNSSANLDGLLWRGKPSHLAFLISQLIEEGYVEPPRKSDGDINIEVLSNMILDTFGFVSKKPALETLKKYVNVDTDKHNELSERFVNHGFHLPNSKIMK